MDILEELLNDTLIETASMVEKRNNKLCLIEDVYKLEDLLGRGRLDFYHLYDSEVSVLISYAEELSKLQMNKMMPNRGLSRH